MHCNVNVINRISCFYLIFFLEGTGVALATLTSPWLRPWTETRQLIMPPPLIGRGIIKAMMLSNVCLSVVCLTSLCRVHRAYRLDVRDSLFSTYKSRTERPRKTKIGTEVVHVTHDSNTIFKDKRSRSSGRRPALLTASGG